MELEQLTMEDVRKGFAESGYISEEEVIMTTYLALRLGKPLLVTGPPGVGKTEIAKVLSKMFNTELIRLQCYEGLDETRALYEWDYKKQLLMIQMGKEGKREHDLEKSIFSKEYLLERPLLKAIRADKKVVLLIDEIDKADEEFEAFLFEILSDFQVSIPELGTVSAKHIPIVILTSNNERDLSDGLKRRCVFLYIDYPTVDKEVQIINAKVPNAGDKLSMEIAKAINHIRSNLDIKKKPSVSETLDWTRSLALLNADRLNPEAISNTLNIIFKDEDDLDAFRERLGAESLYKIVEQP